MIQQYKRQGAAFCITDFGPVDDDFLPFRDVINEYYAKNISKKIKSIFKAKGESGKHVASSPPYGYLKDSEDKDIL